MESDKILVKLTNIEWRDKGDFPACASTELPVTWFLTKNKYWLFNLLKELKTQCISDVEGFYRNKIVHCRLEEWSNIDVLLEYCVS